MRAVLHCVYLAWRHTRCQIEVMISGILTCFSTTRTALREVKETEECDESHVDLTSQCGKSPVTMRAVLQCVYLAWRHTRCQIEVIILGLLTRFSTTKTALLAVKETKEGNESHVDLTRQCGMSPVTMSAIFHCVYLA